MNIKQKGMRDRLFTLNKAKCFLLLFLYLYIYNVEGGKSDDDLCVYSTIKAFMFL